MDCKPACQFRPMNPAAHTFRFEIGPYWIQLPLHADITASVKKPPSGAHQIAWTTWVVSLGRFQLFIYLDPNSGFSDLKSFIDQTTKSDVITSPIGVNNIPGVMHGDYSPPRTWIDWWFKKGDTMICLCLQSKQFPFIEPTPEEVAEHNSIVNSIKYCPDFPGERPPADG